jgi:probable HAF family extracellular repeat protein
MLRSNVNICACLVWAALALAANAGLITVTDLGANFRPKAVNNSGMIVGQDTSTGTAALWQNGTMTSLGTLGGSQSFANDINDSGVVVGWSYDSAGKKKAFRWDAVNGMANLGAGQTLEGAAEAVNNNGDIVGWRTNGTVTRSAQWTPGNPQWVTIFDSETVNHKSLGINEQGVIVGITLNSNGNLVDSFFYDGTLGTSNFTGIMATLYNPQAGVNNSLLTAGTNGDQAAYLTIGPNQLSNLDKLLPTDPTAAAYGLNDNGLIVGASGDKGFLFDSNLSQLYDANNFSRSGFSIDQIGKLTGMNNNGFYIGEGIVGGLTHGIAGNYAIPEPSSAALLMLATVGLWQRRKRLS